jgi:hypothetical protein
LVSIAAPQDRDTAACRDTGRSDPLRALALARSQDFKDAPHGGKALIDSRRGRGVSMYRRLRQIKADAVDLANSLYRSEGTALKSVSGRMSHSV